MRSNDALGAAELVEGRQPKDGRTASLLLAPQPIHDQLEVGGFDPVAGPIVGHDHASAGLPEQDLAVGHVIEDPLDELWFDGHVDRSGGRGVVAIERLHDRIPCRGPIEVADPVVIGQEVDPALEPIELGQAVLADRDHEVRAQVAPRHRLRELAGERPLAVTPRVIQEVLLELVENEQQVGPETLRPALDQLVEMAGLRRRFGCPLPVDEASRRLDRDGESDQRVVAPGRVFDHDEGRSLELGVRIGRPLRVEPARLRGPGLAAELMHDAGPQDGRLADAALAVDEGQARRLQVVGDDLALVVAPEEVRRVILVVGDQALVWRRHVSCAYVPRVRHARSSSAGSARA